MANKVCDECTPIKKTPVNVPYIVHESAMARMERQIKRLWITILVLIGVILACNVGWLIYESQFETYTYEQDGAGINNINNGQQGDVLNGSEIKDTQEKIG